MPKVAHSLKSTKEKEKEEKKSVQLARLQNPYPSQVLTFHFNRETSRLQDMRMVLGSNKGTNIKRMDPFDKQEHLRHILVWVQRTEKLQLASNRQSSTSLPELSEGLGRTTSVPVSDRPSLLALNSEQHLLQGPLTKAPDGSMPRCFPALISTNS